jgi:hypothetical protein
MQVEKALHTHRYEHIKLKNLNLGILNKNTYMRRESNNTKRKKPHHIIIQQFADDMFLYEIIILEKLNMAKNYLNSIEYVCMYIFFPGYCRRKDLIKKYSPLIYI